MRVERVEPTPYVRADGSYNRHPIWTDGVQLEVEQVTKLPGKKAGLPGPIFVTFKVREEGAMTHNYTRFNIELPLGRGLTRFDVIDWYKQLNTRRMVA